MSKVIKVMYHGERVGLFGEIFHLFKEKNGTERRFGGSFKRVRFGDVYPMVDNRMKTQPEVIIPQPWEPTDQELHEYEAAKLAVRHEREQRKKDMVLKAPNPKIVQAVDLLRPFYQTMKDSDRRRFMGWVANECSKKKGRRK